jgi:hypothetical protein
MSVNTTRPRIIAAWQQITGVQHVYAHIPRVIQPAELPGVIVFPGEASYEDFASDMTMENRVYRCWLFLAEAKLGVEGQAEIDADPWFDRVRSHFVARPGLELDDTTPPQDIVFDSTYEGDSGFTIRPYGNKQYGIIEFRLRVNELADIAYQD